MNKNLNVASILDECICDELYDLLHDVSVKLNYIGYEGDENVIWCIAECEDGPIHIGYSEFGTDRG